MRFSPGKRPPTFSSGGGGKRPPPPFRSRGRFPPCFSRSFFVLSRISTKYCSPSFRSKGTALISVLVLEIDFIVLLYFVILHLVIFCYSSFCYVLIFFIFLYFVTFRYILLWFIIIINFFVPRKCRWQPMLLLLNEVGTIARTKSFSKITCFTGMDKTHE